MDPNCNCVDSGLNVVRDVNSNYSCTDGQTDIQGVSSIIIGSDNSYSDDHLGKIIFTFFVISEFFLSTIA